MSRSRLRVWQVAEYPGSRSPTGERAAGSETSAESCPSRGTTPMRPAVFGGGTRLQGGKQAGQWRVLGELGPAVGAHVPG